MVITTSAYMSGVGRTFLRVGLDSIKMSAQGRLKCPSALGGEVNFRMLYLSPVAKPRCEMLITVRKAAREEENDFRSRWRVY